MSKVQMLRAFVNQRLTAAADEIFELFERTIAEYEDELYRSTENHRQQKLLDDVFNHEVRSHRADVQQLVVEEEVPPEQQEWSSSLDQEDPEPPHIKEEQEALWTSQEQEQLEEADIKFLFSSVPVKSEEADGEDCGGPEPARCSDPDTHLQPYDKTSHSESETDDSRDWEESHSGVNSLQNNEVPVSDVECNTGETSVSSSECAGRFGHKENLLKHTRFQAFSCSDCGQRFPLKKSLMSHMGLNSDGKSFSRPFCKTILATSSDLVRHTRIHTGEKPFSCSVCNKRFSQRGNLKQHLSVHTGEKPFSCSDCNKRFAQQSTLRRHLIVHTGEKPFSCSVCHKNFTRLYYVKNHKCSGNK